jgi:hypothetical protein
VSPIFSLKMRVFLLERPLGSGSIMPPAECGWDSSTEIARLLVMTARGDNAEPTSIS